MTNIPDYAQNVVTVYDCISLGGDWRNQDINFDNVANALLVLFEMFVFSGWQIPMFNTMDAVNIDMQPNYYCNPVACLYSIFVMIFLFLFIRNIFTGVVTDSFIKQTDVLMIGSGLTTIQRRWLKQCKQVYKITPMPKIQPESSTYFFYQITKATLFKGIILCALMLNAIVISLVWFRNPSELKDFRGNSYLNLLI